MLVNLSLVALAACAVDVLASPYPTSTTTAKGVTTAKSSTSTKVPTTTKVSTTTKVYPTTKTSKTTKIPTTTKPSTITKSSTPTKTTTTATSTPTLNCAAPPPPANRTACPTSGSGSFTLRLGQCGNAAYDQQWLDPVTNTTSNSADVFVAAAPPANAFLYPAGGFTFGPWAWLGEFAGAVANSSAAASAAGLYTATFASGNSFSEDSTYDCALTTDGVPFLCGFDSTGNATWYIEAKTGRLFSAEKTVTASGFTQVVPYIFQGCTS